MNPPRCKLFLAFALVLLPMLSSRASAQCTFLKYTVLSPSQVLVRCKEDVSSLQEFEDRSAPSRRKVGDAVVTEVASPYRTMPAVVRLPHNGNPLWLVVELGSGGTLAAATKYSVAISFPSGDPDKPTAMAAIAIDTISSYAVNPAISPNLPTVYRFVSSTVAIPSQGAACTLKVIYAPRPTSPLSAKPLTSHRTDVDGCAFGSSTPNDYEHLGVVLVTLRSPLTLQAIPDSLTGVTDVFGVTPSIPATSRMAVQKIPASKDVAEWYFNLTFLGATGSGPSWTLDGQVIPHLVPGLYRGWEINPFVGSANVGQGSISSAKFTDTIDLGSKAVRTIRSDVQWTLAPGVNFETDKEFDRWNGLATIDAKFNLPHLYNPQLRQQLQEVKQLVRDNPTYSYTVADVGLPTFGYVFEVHGLLETGSKIGTSVVQNSDKSASLSLPAYSIARPALQLHGLLQLYRFSVDCVVTGRYLALTEDSVLEHKDKSLYLYSFHGWKAYQVLTGAYQVDPLGHWALSLTYDNGFSPPTYSRANSVQLGLLIKY